MLLSGSCVAFVGFFFDFMWLLCGNVIPILLWSLLGFPWVCMVVLWLLSGLIGFQDSWVVGALVLLIR